MTIYGLGKLLVDLLSDRLLATYPRPTASEPTVL